MLKALVYAYLIGGITFIPFMIIALLFVVYLTSPIQSPDTAPISDQPTSDVVTEKFDPAAIHESYKVGWLTIRSSYSASATDGTYVGMVMQGYRNFMDNKKGPERRPKDLFFAVLRHDTLLLYESEEQIGCKQIIKMSLHEVDIYPKGLPEGELFLKRNAIRLKKKGDVLKIAGDKEGPQTEYYIFHTSPPEKEDWYFALVAAQNLGPGTVGDLKAELDTASLRHLQNTLQSNDLQREVAWLNGILGRIFLALHHTRFAEDYFIDKLMKKISRVKKPSFLSDILVRKVHVGDTIPYFTKPKLLELNEDGKMIGECNVSYAGNFRIEIQTIASINISSKLKPMNVTLVLAVVLKQWHGKMKVLIKPQPSNRIWFGFYNVPKVDIAIEPIVSSRQIRYPMILKAIEARINEMIVESVVLPNMDDVPFFPTLDEERRGGIWSSTERKDDDRMHAMENSREPLEPSLSKDEDDGQSTRTTPFNNNLDEKEAANALNSPRRAWFSRAGNNEGSRPQRPSQTRNASIGSISSVDQTVLTSEDDTTDLQDANDKATLDSSASNLKQNALQKEKVKFNKAKATLQQPLARSLLVVPAPGSEDETQHDSVAIPAIDLEGSSSDRITSSNRSNLSQSVATATSVVRRWGVNMYQRRKYRSQEANNSNAGTDVLRDLEITDLSSRHKAEEVNSSSLSIPLEDQDALRTQPGAELSLDERRHNNALKLLSALSPGNTDTEQSLPAALDVNAARGNHALSREHDSYAPSLVVSSEHVASSTPQLPTIRLLSIPEGESQASSQSGSEIAFPSLVTPPTDEMPALPSPVHKVEHAHSL